MSRTVTIGATGNLLVPFRGPLPRCLLVLLDHVIVAVGARAVEYERIPFVVGGVLEILRTLVAVGAEPLAVDRSEEDLLVQVEVEFLTPLRIRLELFVAVAVQTVRDVVVLGPGFGRRRLSRSPPSNKPTGEKEDHEQREEPLLVAAATGTQAARLNREPWQGGARRRLLVSPPAPMDDRWVGASEFSGLPGGAHSGARRDVERVCRIPSLSAREQHAPGSGVGH
jgi:hypothetical protein